MVGIDGIPLGEQLQISLSTVAQPHLDMASKAVEVLIERVEGDTDQGPRQAEFPTNFVQRESVGAKS